MLPLDRDPPRASSSPLWLGGVPVAGVLISLGVFLLALANRRRA
jgi:hypothetical protein